MKAESGEGIEDEPEEKEDFDPSHPTHDDLDEFPKDDAGAKSTLSPHRFDHVWR